MQIKHLLLSLILISCFYYCYSYQYKITNNGELSYNDNSLNFNVKFKEYNNFTISLGNVTHQFVHNKDNDVCCCNRYDGYCGICCDCSASIYACCAQVKGCVCRPVGKDCY